MIHAVFQANDVTTLQGAISLDASLDGPVVLIRDDYAVGPLAGIYTSEGLERRKQWWREVLAGGDYQGLVDSTEPGDVAIVEKILETLREQEEESLWIWVAPNQHDVSGYYWLVSQLKEFQGRVFILFLNNLPFINEKGHIFYPVNLFNIPPREFLKAKKLNRPVTPAEFEMDTDEWTRLCNENKGIRTLEGGKKLLQHEDDYYDKELLRAISPDWQKASRVLHNFFSKAKVTTGDAYLLWRLKLLIAAGRIDAQGAVGNMKEFEVKSKVAVPQD